MGLKTTDILKDSDVLQITVGELKKRVRHAHTEGRAQQAAENQQPSPLGLEFLGFEVFVRAVEGDFDFDKARELFSKRLNMKG